MNTSVEGIIVNNCQYTPIYLIQDPGATQTNTYVLTPSTVEQPKPVNNLKSFYENSGNIENGFVNFDVPGRSTAKKKESVLIRNNLKLASFLLPKTENVNKQYVVENIVVKPNITTNNPTTTTTTINQAIVNSTIPKLDMNRKIVKVKDVPFVSRPRLEKLLPKTTPKEKKPITANAALAPNTLNPKPTKHTSVQLIKLGESYHSLNHLSDDQVKMVKKALNMFSDPDKTVSEPTYDPVTNTKYIYKVVSPKDLKVVAKKKFVMKDKKSHSKIVKRVEEKVKPVILEEDIEEEPEPPTEEKVTRSGRKVKFPRQMLPQDSPQKTKIKKNETILSCFQCSEDFGSIYRLQKHYENHPTHIPMKIHSNLFHCLLAIIKSGSGDDKTNIFIQQLEQLVVKLKSLLPCLLKKVDGSEGQSCTINDDVGRLFGLNPGKYNIDVDALDCVKDKNGFCIHNPPKLNQFIIDPKTNNHLHKHPEEIAGNDVETENCARINSVAKWPTVSKRIWKLKSKTNEMTAKKMRLKSEGDCLIDLGTEDIFIPESNSTNIAAEDDVTKLLETPQDCKVNGAIINNAQSDKVGTETISKPQTNYVQFHSAHFDIRSSPIKPSAAVFRKFQINPSKMSSYEVIRSLELDGDNNPDSSKHVAMQNSDNILVTLPNSNNGLHVTLPSSENGLLPTITTANNSLHMTMSNSDNSHNPSLCPSVTMSNSGNNLHVPLSSSHNNLHVTLSSSDNGLHVPLSNSDNSFQITLSNSDNALHAPLSNSDDLHVSLPNSDNSFQITLSNSDNALHAPLSNSDDLHVPLPNSNDLHVNLADSENSLNVELPNPDNNIHITLPNSTDNLHLPLTGSDNSLSDIFKDDVDLSCKDSNLIDSELKDWIISTSVKSESTLSKSDSLIESALLHVRNCDDNKSISKSVSHDMPSLESTDSRLLPTQGESVLNFLDTLSNDLAYPETEIRNNSVDFQLDLFTFQS